jgi:hypothetical protein
MYLVYAVILFVLTVILMVTLREEIKARKGITHGIANKYWMLKEKRRFVRFDADLKLRYNRVDSGSGSSDSKTQNVSRKGLCISSYEKFNQKDKLEIEIEVPGFSKLVKLTGSVMWVKELSSPDEQGRRIFYTGVKFYHISPESEAILVTHLNTLKRP